MEDWPSIFSGNAEAARDLASFLSSRGHRCYVADRLGPVVSPNGGRDSYSVVLVPANEEEQARAAEREWSQQNVRDAQRLKRRLGRVLSLALFAPGAWLLGYLLLPERFPTPSIGGIAVVWLVAIVAVAQFEQRRHQRERVAPAA